MSRHERAFRRLVRLYPAAFRAEYEDQLVGLFADQLRDARNGPALAVVRLWAQVLIDLIATAPQEHLRKESPVLQPVEPGAAAAATATRSPRQRAAVVIASVPLIALPAVWVVAPAFLEPVGFNPPAVLGLPMGVVLMALAGGMALVGWLLSRRTQSVRVALGAVAILTIPALILIVMTPALVLIIVNLA